MKVVHEFHEFHKYNIDRHELSFLVVSEKVWMSFTKTVYRFSQSINELNSLTFFN